MLGVPVVSSPKGIEGIDYKLNAFKSPLVHKSKSVLLRYARNVLKNNQVYKKNSKKNKGKYIAIYNMKEIVRKFQLSLLKKN